MPRLDIARGVALDAASTDADVAREVSSWTALGPGNIGGRTRALLIDPRVPSTMYAAGVAGGIWKTANGGQSWTPLDDAMASLAVTTMAFQRQGAPEVQPSVIYAGTGEGFFNFDSVRGAGIFRSLDEGVTWAQLPETANSDFHYVNKIVASPNDPNVIYAATRTGVYRLEADGSVELLIGNGTAPPGIAQADDTVAGFTDIEVRNDVTPDVLIAWSGIFLNDGLYRSLDGGDTWDRVLSPDDAGRADLAIAPSDPSIMYALVADAIGDQRLLNVYRSEDGGASWTPRVAGSFDRREPNWLLLTNPLAANFSVCNAQSDFLLHQGWYDNIIAVAPHDPNVVYAGGIDLFRSDDGGATWGGIGFWWVGRQDSAYLHADQHTIVFHPDFDGGANQTMFVGNDGGVFRTDAALDGETADQPSELCTPASSGVSWTSLNNGYEVTQFYHGRPLAGVLPGYAGGTQDNGTLYSRDEFGTNGWTELFGGDGGYVGFDVDGTLFLETTGKSLRRGRDNDIFRNIVDGPGQITESGQEFLFIAPFRQDPSDADTIWYGGRIPWRTQNAVSAPTAQDVRWSALGAAFDESISAWAIDPNNGDRVWAGTTNGDVLTVDASNANASTTWNDVTPPFSSDAYISWIEVDGNDPSGNTVWVTNSFYGGERVFRTVDGGQTWTDETGGLPDIPIHTVVIQPQAPENRYLGTDLGIFVSLNGEDWANANDGFTNTVVETLEFADPLTLYAFTHGRGAFRATLAPPVNQPPSLAALPDPLTVNEDSGPRTVDLSGITPGPARESDQRIVSVTVTSDDPRLVPDPTLSGQIGADLRFTFAPVPNASGATTLTVTAQDDGGTADGGQDTSVRQLTVNILPINDPPQAANDAYSLREDQRFTSSIGLLVNDIDVDADDVLTATVARDVEAGELELRPDGVFTFVPPADEAGTFSFAYRVEDRAGTSSTAEVTLDVSATNDPPTIDPPPALNPLLEDAGRQSVLLTGIRAGPTNEQGQTVTVDVRTNAGELLTDLSAVREGTTATVSFTPVANASGAGDVIVRFLDDGGLTNGGDDETEVQIPVRIDPVNDPPSFGLEAPPGTTGPIVIRVTELSAGPRELGQDLTIDVTVDPPSRVESVTIDRLSAADAEVTLIPTEAGPATITVQVTDDGGTARGGVSTQTQTLAVEFLLPSDGCGCRASGRDGDRAAVWLGIGALLILGWRARSRRTDSGPTTTGPC